MSKKKLLLSSALLLAVCGPAFAGSGHGPEEIHWSYGGEAGPQAWGNLKADYAVCGQGHEQSPINIDEANAIDAKVGKIEFAYKTSPLNILNNGHTIQANYEPGSSITIGGEKFELLQFHFHTPSEHQINAKSSDMEVHFVHKNAAGELAVVGVMMDKGSNSKDLQVLWDNIPAEVDKEATVAGVTINAAALLPANTDAYYHYQGSLTTPPCSEIVNWYVLKDPIKVSDEQVAQFAKAVGDNARPIQGMHRRFVLHND